MLQQTLGCLRNKSSTIDRSPIGVLMELRMQQNPMKTVDDVDAAGRGNVVKNCHGAYEFSRIMNLDHLERGQLITVVPNQ